MAQGLGRGEPDVIVLTYLPPSTDLGTPHATPEASDTSSGLAAPAGFMPFCDQASGIGLYIPDTWHTDVKQPGRFAIVESFEPDPDSGMGGLAPSETKCDLYIAEDGADIADEIASVRAEDDGSLTSDREITLVSGETAVRMGFDGVMGDVVAFYTSVEGRGLALYCYGDFSQVDEIAGTIGPCD